MSQHSPPLVRPLLGESSRLANLPGLRLRSRKVWIWGKGRKRIRSFFSCSSLAKRKWVSFCLVHKLPKPLYYVLYPGGRTVEESLSLLKQTCNLFAIPSTRNRCFYFVDSTFSLLAFFLSAFLLSNSYLSAFLCFSCLLFGPFYISASVV